MLLNYRQEKELIKYINDLCIQELPPTRALLRNFILKISGKEASKCQLNRFLKQHNIDFISRYTSSMDIVRKRADSAFKYTLYFKLLKRKMEEYKINLQLIYNIDEKGFLIRVLSKIKKIFLKC